VNDSSKATAAFIPFIVAERKEFAWVKTGVRTLEAEDIWSTCGLSPVHVSGVAR
jgi:hypothetical protein